MSTVTRHTQNWVSVRTGLVAVLLMLLSMLVVLGSNPVQAAPLAGTTIGNQAAATYTDASATSRTATSNTVNTVVQQVASFTLTASQTKTSAPSAPISFSHTITNTGNGPDSFTFAALGNSGTFTMSVLPTPPSVYADANCDGIADNSTAITSVGPLAAFTGSTCVVVQANVPGSATSGQQNQLLLTASSVFNNAVTQSNTDTTNVTGNAVVNITNKTISAPSGNPGSGPYTYTINFTNTGAATAQNVIIADVIPSGMTYVAGSGRWSVSGATALTDAAGGDFVGINFDFNVTNTGAITAVIASIAPNVTQNITFQVNVPITTPPGTINNTARLCYTDNTVGGAQVPATCNATNVTTTGATSNIAPFTVNQLASVRANASSTDSSGAASDTVTVPSATQGATVAFNNYIWNLGNGADSFVITLSAGTFPVGTTFQLFQQDGVTPLVASTTPSIPASVTAACTVGNGFVQDTTNNRCGYRVVLRASLPSSTSGGGAYSVVKTATSTFNNTVFDPVTDTLTTITASTVDLRNGAANTLGTGAGPEGSPVTTNSVNPGSSTTFVLKVNNTAGPSDTYNLQASTDNSFATTVLPSGWTVTFRADGGAGDCSTTGATITNTGVVNAASVVTVCAIVAVPVSAAASPAPGTSIFFRAISPTTGSLDRKHDAVVVNTVRNIVFTPNNTGQVFAGGTVVYTHTVTNNGNVTEGATAGQVTLGGAMTGQVAGWAFSVYWDRNNDGVLDVGDPVIADLSALTGGTGGASTAAGLDAGESARLFVRVNAPVGANPGDTNVTTITATITGSINGVAAPTAVAVTDTTQVITGQVRLVKEQALDANCDGTADGAFQQTPITTGAIPGACIRYRITIENQGLTPVTTLVVSDATPANTTYHITVPAAITGAGNTVTAPGSGATGTVQATLPTLAAGATQFLTFGVRIDP